MSSERPHYKCTMAELYAIMLLAIDNLNSDLTAFAAKSSNYTAALVTMLRGLRTSAMVLPDEESRNGVHQILGNKLPGLLEPIKQDYNDLKGLIRDGWPTEDPKPRYETAGLAEYNNIGTDGWEHVELLHNNMNAFITDAANAPILSSPGGMVAGFPAQVVANFTAFNAVYPLFLSTRETATAAAAKMKANNLLYDTCMNGFMKFGVESVFRNDEDGQKRYTFSVLKKLVSPPGAASLDMHLKKAGTNEAVVGATVIIQSATGTPRTLVSDAEGNLSFTGIDADTYTVTIKVTGQPDIVKTKEVNVGTQARMVVEIP